MATVTYNGRMAYTEFKHAGVTYGFARGGSRNDIPDDMVVYLKLDTSGTWSFTGASAQVVEQTVKMAEVVDVDDSTKEESPFNPNWTRGEMIKWFSARGERTPKTATKATLTAMAEALLNPEAPATEEESSEGDE